MMLLYLVLPWTAGALHLSRVRFDSALHWVHVTSPPSIVSLLIGDRGYFIRLLATSYAEEKLR